MTQSELTAWAGRITYKPGWVLTATLVPDDPAGRINITVGEYGRDSTAPDTMRMYHHSRVVFAGTFEEFVEDAITTFHELENHETREWFRVDGRHWPEYLPHDPKAVVKGFRNEGARYDEP